jgi:hypothetical protein
MGHAFQTGNTWAVQEVLTGCSASMGPRLFRLKCSMRATHGPRSGFNGATPFQTWKYRPGTEVRCPGRRFNGARCSEWKYFLDIVVWSARNWFNGPRLFRLEMVGGISSRGIAIAFNGPRLFRRGNGRGRDQKGDAAERASMGPTLLRRGNQATIGVPRPRTSFNGARLLDVDILSRDRRRLPPASSMGPRLFRGEIVATQSNGRRRARHASMGHAFSDVKIGTIHRLARQFFQLQWGHAFSDVEMSS